MAAAKRGQYQRQGLSSVRRDYNVLSAVRRFRGQSAPSWTEYVRTTQRGSKRYNPK
jgi:hypothetical protein